MLYFLKHLVIVAACCIAVCQCNKLPTIGDKIQPEENNKRQAVEESELGSAKQADTKEDNAKPLNASETFNQIHETLTAEGDTTNNLPPQDCYGIYMNNPAARSGIYNINVGTEVSPVTITVYCDMETDGGGWTVIQRRSGDVLHFYRDYQSFAEGFGLPNLDHWLGNVNLNLMTRRENYELRVDLQQFNLAHAFARYSTFNVADACDGFRLTVGGYSGNAGDSMSYNNGRRFTTFDRDQDGWSEGNCAVGHQAAWWHGFCTWANLNGLYQREGTVDVTTIFWYHLNRWYDALKMTEMKIRPRSYTCPL